MAADGRRSWSHEPTAISHEGQSDSVQKIFKISHKDVALAYCIRGATVSEDTSWDIAIELRKSVDAISPKGLPDCLAFMRALLFDLQRRIELAIGQGRLDGYPNTELCFVGYFRNAPSWIDGYYHPYPDYDGYRFHAMKRQCDPVHNFLSGSVILIRMIESDDPRLAHTFSGLFHENMSLEAAAIFARKYIEMCCSPFIRGLEPDGCKTIGGHIHVATVTPRDSSWLMRWLRWSKSSQLQPAGFQWVIPPRDEICFPEKLP